MALSDGVVVESVRLEKTFVETGWGPAWPGPLGLRGNDGQLVHLRSAAEHSVSMWLCTIGWEKAALQ